MHMLPLIDTSTFIMPLMAITICTTCFDLLRTHGTQIIGIAKCLLSSWLSVSLMHFSCFGTIALVFVDKTHTDAPNSLLVGAGWLDVGLNKWVYPDGAEHGPLVLGGQHKFVPAQNQDIVDHNCRWIID